mgnify:CR=1 FL=1
MLLFLHYKTGNSKRKIKKSIIYLLMLLFSALLFQSCHSGQLYKRYIAIPDGVWNRGDRIRFVADIEGKMPAEVNVTLLVRYTDIYEYNNLQITMHLSSPEKVLLEEKNYDLPMKLPEGGNAGKGLGDIWDIKLPLLQQYQLPVSGNYTVEIEHTMPVEELPFITELGLLIEQQ